MPSILEQTINNNLKMSQLPSFKIAGNRLLGTIVLRFDECVADASVSPIYRSTPQGCYHRKPQIQFRRDKERIEQHRNLSAEKQFKTIKQRWKRDRIYKDDSALHSTSLFETAIPARRQKAQEDIHQAKRLTNSILSVTDIKEDKQDRDELQLFGLYFLKKNPYKDRTDESENKQTKHGPSKLSILSRDNLCVSAQSQYT